ncbi:hypothetical protein MRX96_026038 [Rhipicephalus microplus]
MASQGTAQRPRSCCSATRRRPRSADRLRPETGASAPVVAADDHLDEGQRLPALLPQVRPLSSAVGRGPHGNHQGDRRRPRSRSNECEELTLVPLPRDEAQRRSPSGKEVRGSSRGPGNHGDLSEVPKNEVNCLNES